MTCEEPGPRPVAPAAGRPAAPPESRGCLYALSQPPLMLFLAVIASLLGLGALYDLLDLYRW
ncbi:hypothetical protein HCK00_13350 [Streptomyces sp. PLAI1-29]|uniref:Uncharacterized protein n=1 Tax=Streptomyces zingiberis TaxID=2053010 RepID=A0ABX1BUT1_9ACTN|nr:hypothetical protein [Streptomyces zingiberis]